MSRLAWRRDITLVVSATDPTCAPTGLITPMGHIGKQNQRFHEVTRSSRHLPQGTPSISDGYRALFSSVAFERHRDWAGLRGSLDTPGRRSTARRAGSP